MLWTIVVVLGVLWLLGFSFQVGGGLIHLLLVAALVVLAFNFLSGRRPWSSSSFGPQSPRARHARDSAA